MATETSLREMRTKAAVDATAKEAVRGGRLRPPQGMSPEQHDLWAGATEKHKQELEQEPEEEKVERHGLTGPVEFGPAKAAARMAGEAALGMNPATSIPLDAYYMKEAIEEGSPGGIALAGLAFIPLVGEMKSLLPKQLSKLAKEAGDTRPISEIVEDAVSLRGGPKSHTIENELGLKPGKLFHSKNPKEVLEHYSSAPIPEHEARSLGKANNWMADWEEDGSKLPEVIEYIDKVSRGRRRTPQEQRAILDWFAGTAPGNY